MAETKNHNSATAVFLGMFAYYASHGNPLLVPLLPFIAEDLHLGAMQMGMMITLFALPGCLIPFFGVLEDRMGRRPMFYFCLIGSMVSIALGGLSTSFYWLGACRFMHGFFTSPLEAMVYTILADNFEGDARAQCVSKTTTVLYAGVATIPLVATAIQYFFGWRVAVLIPMAMGVPTLMLGLRVLPFLKESDNRITLKDYGREIKASCLSWNVYSLILMRMLSTFCLFGIIYQFLPVIVTDAKISPSFVGIGFAVASAGMTIGSYLARWHMRKMNNTLLVCIISAAIGAGLAIFLESGQVVGMVFGLAICGWGYGVLNSLMLVYFANTTTERSRGVMQALYSLGFRLSQSIGVPFMGFIYLSSGYGAVLASGIVCCMLFAMMGFFRIRPEENI